jgi:Rv0078B-related antitoxin
VTSPAHEILAKLTPAQKLRTAMRIYWSARALKAAALRSQHPQWSQAEIARAVRDAFLFRHG